MDEIRRIGQAARATARLLAYAPSQQKYLALLSIAQALEGEGGRILDETAIDLEHARSMGLAGAMLDRLELTPARIAAMATGGLSTTPLGYAAHHLHEALVRFYLSVGARSDLPTAADRQPVALAEARGCLELAVILRSE